MPLPFTARSLDPDAAAFCARSGASDVAAIDAFVKGVKDLGLWDKMVCWPLRRQQNSGTNTAYSLGGLGAYDGTLVNGPTWGTDGIAFDGSDDHVTLPNGSFGTGNAPTSVWAFLKNDTNTARMIALSQGNNNAATDSFTLEVPSAGLTNDAVGIAFTNGTIAAKSTVWKSLLIGNTDAGFWGKDGGAVTQFTLNNTLNKTGTSCAVGIFGNPAGVGPFDGLISAVIRINATPTTQLNSDIHAIYRATLGANLGLPDYDPATIEYAARSGATDLANIDAFVRGVKDLGLWNSMVCWPLRSTQNAGTGTTAYSLGGLGTFNGTLVNEPSWGADGMTFDNASSQYISTAFSFDPATLSTGFATIVKPTDSYPTADLREICGNRQTAASALYKLTGGQQDITLFDSVADHNTASVNSRIGTSFADTRHFAGGFTDSSTRQFFNQADATTTTATSTGGTITSGSHAFQIGRAGTYGTARTWTGEISVVTLIRRSTITAQDIENLRTLYKSTLGTGLGLP
jgi:hypothetical protein